MHLLPIKKKLIIGVSSLLLASCTPQAVYCHQWTPQERESIYQADITLPHENPLHGVIKDYERLCAQ